jgi:hypothetical protein
MERQIEAVFVSYALHGMWDPQEAAMWLPQDCKGMNRANFLHLLRDAELLNNIVGPQAAHNVFCKLNNPVRADECFCNIIAEGASQRSMCC